DDPQLTVRMVEGPQPVRLVVDPLAEIDLAFPFWIKPVKSVSSYLAFRIRDQRDFDQALRTLRSEIDRLAVPFDHILGHARLPPQIAAVSGRHCIAEAEISRGRQCTLEGYVYEGEVVVYGVFDSVRAGGGRSSFARYQYPSTLPARVRRRMAAITRRFMTHIGYDGAPFNVEYFWDPRDDAIRMLEVNTRISKSHCPLFKMVDGEYHHAVNLALGLGRRPDFPFRRGQHRVAAKFMLRHFRDARVARVPDAAELEALRARFPDTEIELHVAPGMRLSQLHVQDSYSYEVAVIYMGAPDQPTLLRNYARLVDAMNLVFEDDGGERVR
ncbi:MAG: ATP-grasp domain-containing protein, partial [Burkholderiales bacterium]